MPEVDATDARLLLALGREQLDQIRLLREMRSRGPRYGVDHLGRLVQRCHGTLLAFHGAGVAGRSAVLDVFAAPGCGTTHTW